MDAIRRLGLLVLVAWLALAASRQARAQSFGIELHNTLMPASGGMAGASLSRPQDVQSAINGNPATLTQFRGTQFGMGGAWAEPTYNITQLAPLPLVGVSPYSDRSGTPGGTVPNIGVTQDLSALGLPATFGMGLMTSAGAGVDFRGVPASNGTSAQYLALDVVTGMGIDVTQRLSLGAGLTLGNSFLDGPFTDTGGMVPAYGLRGTLGANYAVSEFTTAGAYWQTDKHFTFDDAASVGAPFNRTFDVEFEHPENFGLGLANNSLASGRLLLAVDVLYKLYGEADFLDRLYDNQWVYQFGMQYSATKRLRLRTGYAYNENPMADAQITSIGGVPLPDGVPALRYIQGQFAAICQHRFTAGFGMRDALPGLDMDFFAGGMFENTDQFAATIARVESYWVGLGMTWRFGRGASEPIGVADHWSRD
ncbi:MAG: outer membrane protein transport protein [Pirellulales bacterium]|nr:outer membrane protein transport protein [Pirellulales bacterium]